MRFRDQLAACGYATYGDYLRSAHWQAFRRAYKSTGLRMTCVVCDRRPINLHHHTYVRLGCERLADVTPLCREHHTAVHQWLKDSGRIFVEYTHEAVAALGGVAPTATAPKAPATGKRGKRQRQRARKRAKQEALAAARVLATATDPVWRAELARADSLKLSQGERKVVNFKVRRGELAALGRYLDELTRQRAAREKIAAKQRRLEEHNARIVAAREAKAEQKKPKGNGYKHRPRATDPFQLNEVPSYAGDGGNWRRFLTRRAGGQQAA